MDGENESLTDDQMDALVDGTNEPANREIPMSDKDIPTPQVEPEKYIEFKHGDKPIRATMDEVIKWAQQGRDYPQKMQEFNKTRQTFETERQAFIAQQKEYEQKFSPYRQIDEWANKNPAHWQRIQQEYQRAQTQQPGQQSVDPVIQQYAQKFESELGEVKNFIQSVRQKEEMANRQSEDQKLDTEMKSIREAYKDLDFDSPNEEGKSLEYQVLEHAKNNGIKSFRTAFNDFYHDRLIERAATLAKQDVSKGIQKNSKLGVLGKSPTQGKTYSEPKNISKQSYEDLAAEALAELRAGS